jgi:PleD family two-component response regulator
LSLSTKSSSLTAPWDFRLPQGLSPTVLVVEDDVRLAGLLVETLNAAGIRAVQAHTVAEARDRISDRPNLILMDWILPDGEGTSLIQEIRSDMLLAHIPILMLTGRSQVKEKITGFNSGADDYLTKPFEEPELVARVTALLRRNFRDLGASPLTGLPGNMNIEQEVEKRLAGGNPFDAVYFDINYFKPYNDRYGFARGDEAIRLLAQCAVEERRSNAFIGHIGGDDFVALLSAAEGETYANKVANSFFEKGKQLHDRSDVLRGYYESKDRQGNPQRFPLLSITAAVISTVTRHIQRYAELAQAAAELKAAAHKEGVSVRAEKRLE